MRERKHFEKCADTRYRQRGNNFGSRTIFYISAQRADSLFRPKHKTAFFLTKIRFIYVLCV